MSIKAKILSLVAAFALMAAAISALGLITMRDYDQVIAGYTRASTNAFRAEKLNELIANSSIEMRNIYVANTPQELEKRITRLTGFINETQSLMTTWRSEIKPGEVPEFDKMAYGAKSVGAYGMKVISIARTDGVPTAQAFGMNAKSIAGREHFHEQLDQTIARIQDDLKQRQVALSTYQTQRTTDFLLMAGSGTLIMLLASLWIAIHSIANPLKTVTQSVVQIAEGAYDTAIPIQKTQDEISRLWGAVAILKDRAIEAKRLTDEKLTLHLD